MWVRTAVIHLWLWIAVPPASRSVVSVVPSSGTMSSPKRDTSLNSPSRSKPFGSRGGSSALDGLHLGQSMPAPPHWQAYGPSNGWSGWFSQTVPLSSRSRHIRENASQWLDGASPKDGGL